MSISKRTYAEQSFAYEFGRKLKAARTVSNVSQMALADALEVHRNRVSHWEHGEGMVKPAAGHADRRGLAVRPEYSASGVVVRMGPGTAVNALRFDGRR